ncbi:MAG: crossover junction endodeoxyribonuclease RuvC [Gammaproteobacteria bacterium]|nr:crossover junction endodeoxyribonuclease RuvC [Gammaproteobacteria bacterium]
MTLILGIDPGSRVTGYGLVQSVGARHQYVASGCITTPDGASQPDKLNEIFVGIRELIAEYQPTEFAIERIFMARSADSALKLGQARGVAIVAAVNEGIPVFEYEAKKIKQAVVGTGGAAKSQVQHMITQLLSLPGQPRPDAADALAIALCHIHTQHSLARMKETGSAGATTFRRGRLVRADRS